MAVRLQVLQLTQTARRVKNHIAGNGVTVAGKASEASARAEAEAPAETAAPGAPPFPATPRDLLTAYMLLLLRSWSMHGYQLKQQLKDYGYQPTDPASIYRQLRQLERQGFIHSNWETGDTGPARRTYTITEMGNAFLGTWATAIEEYQKTLKFWTDLYSGVTPSRRSK